MRRIAQASHEAGRTEDLVSCLEEGALLDYLAGRLDGAATARAREHIATCKLCHAIASDLVLSAAASVQTPRALRAASYELAAGANPRRSLCARSAARRRRDGRGVARAAPRDGRARGDQAAEGVRPRGPPSLRARGHGGRGARASRPRARGGGAGGRRGGLPRAGPRAAGRSLAGGRARGRAARRSAGVRDRSRCRLRHGLRAQYTYRASRPQAGERLPLPARCEGPRSRPRHGDGRERAPFFPHHPHRRRGGHAGVHGAGAAGRRARRERRGRVVPGRDPSTNPSRASSRSARPPRPPSSAPSRNPQRRCSRAPSARWCTRCSHHHPAPGPPCPRSPPHSQRDGAKHERLERETQRREIFWRAARGETRAFSSPARSAAQRFCASASLSRLSNLALRRGIRPT